MVPPNDLAELTELSASLGRDLNLVQAGGGNTSLKDSGVLWVKASGKWLAHAADEETFLAAPMNDALQSVKDHCEYVTECRTPSGTVLRPSVETTMHAVLPHRVIVHVHSVNAIASTVQQDPLDVLRPKLQGLSWTWLPYVLPGVVLARAIQELPPPSPDVLILDNHGLVIAAESCDKARALLLDVERRLHLDARRAPPPSLHELATMIPAGFRLPPEDEVHAIATDAFSTDVARRGILYPDQCVYLGLPAIISDGDSAVGAMKRFSAAYGTSPKYLIAPGKGVLISNDLNRAGWELLVALKRVLERLDPARDVHFLDPAEVSRLMNWDAEQYRIAVSGEYNLQVLPRTS